MNSPSSLPLARPRDYCSETISLPVIRNHHRAPQRRWVITLAGSVDIELGDGTRETFLPGDVFLAEDTTGQGHIATPHDWVRVYVDVRMLGMNLAFARKGQNAHHLIEE
jgi:hypothetical protein